MADPEKPGPPPWDAHWRAIGGVGAFDSPLDAMMQRARHVLRREEALGRARRVSGKARIGREELHARLGQLRQHVEALAAEAATLIPHRRRSAEEQALHRHLKALRKAVAPGRHATEHEATIRQRLATLRAKAVEAPALVGDMARAAAQGIDPDARLDLLTPEELADVRDPTAPAVARLLRLEDALRFAGAEATHLLIGLQQPRPEPASAALAPAEARARAIAALLALDPTAQPDLLTEADIDMALGMAAPPPPSVQAPRPGPHERRRGRWLAAHLLGLAVGLGVQPTRDEQSSATSAPDLLIRAVSDLLQETTAHTSCAIVAEMPSGIEGARRLWKPSLRDDLTRGAIATGQALGRRLLRRKFLPDPPT